MSSLAKRAFWLDCTLLFLLTAVLIRPLFRLEYINYWQSIESTFIADARMLSEHLPHPGWQPLWYCGTRFDYIYPPALRYGTAVISKLGGVSTARAYHLYTAIFYVLGIVGVYGLVRAGARSRRDAWLAAAATAMVSPSFLFIKIIRYDSPDWIPQRLHVLTAYGEGPHISALCVLPFALAFSFVALRSWRPIAFAAAAVLCALTVATNFYGAVALAMFFPVAVWSIWVTQCQAAVWLRAGGIAVLAWLLSAFWLTPSYLQVTTVNLGLVNASGDMPSRIIALLVVASFCGISWWWGKLRPDRAWTLFTMGSAVLLSVYILGHFYFGLRIVGDAPRLIPEFDLALILAFFQGIHPLWAHRALRYAALAVMAVVFIPATFYLQHVYSPFPKSKPIAEQYEYRVASWVHDHMPQQRALPSGTVRFWFNAWFDNPQSEGGSAQGILNRSLPDATYQITHGEQGGTALLWLQAMGVDAVIVPDRTSPEPYGDYGKPEKFRGVLPVLNDDGHGTVIYGVPRRQPGIGRVVDTAKIAGVPRVGGGDDVETLTRYVDVVENKEQGLTPVKWIGFDEVDVYGALAKGQSVLVQETYDPAWRAFENDRPVSIRREPVMNFMLLDLPEGTHDIRMRFETPLENRLGQIAFVIGLGAVLLLVGAGVRQYRSPGVVN